VRHGHLPEHEIVTGIAPVAVHAPRVRDRAGRDGERVRLSSSAGMALSTSAASP
jgi:hypothetical protein